MILVAHTANECLHITGMQEVFWIPLASSCLTVCQLKFSTSYCTQSLTNLYCVEHQYIPSKSTIEQKFLIFCYIYIFLNSELFTACTVLNISTFLQKVQLNRSLLLFFVIFFFLNSELFTACTVLNISLFPHYAWLA